jgi:hypothetical protein
MARRPRTGTRPWAIDLELPKNRRWTTEDPRA